MNYFPSQSYILSRSFKQSRFIDRT